MLTASGILFYGLLCAGFDANRQKKVRLEQSIDRFKSFFGVPPTTILPFLSDLKNDNPEIKFRDCLITMNWFFLYDSYHVLAGRWSRCEDYIWTNGDEHWEEDGKAQVENNQITV